MSEQYNAITVENIADGAAIEQVNFQIQKAIENILDVNTDAGVERKIELKLSFKPQDDRAQADIKFQVIAKLAPDSAGSDRLFIGQENGQKKGFVHTAKQMAFDDFQEKTKETKKPGVTTIDAKKGTENA